MEIQDIIQGLTQAEITAINSPDERSLIVNTTLNQAVIYVNGTFKQASFENSDDIPEGLTNKYITTSDLSQITTNQNNIASLQTSKEDTFAKNTAFNKNFGTSAGEVLEGNTTTITTQQSANIATNNAKVSFPEAPSDGKQYARKDAGWEEVQASETASALPVIVIKSNDDTETFTRSSTLMVPWNQEKYKDNGFSHDNTTNNTRAIVDDASTYQFGGRIRVRNTSDQRAQPTVKIFVNGTAQDWNLASGYIRNAGMSSDDWTLEFTYEPEKLNANDYVEIQLSHEESNSTNVESTFIGSESSFWGIKLQGSTGEKGDTGTGSNIVIKKDGVTIGTLTETIDILGGVPVVDEGSNITSIEIGNYAHATGITQIPDDQIKRYEVTGGGSVDIDNYDPENYNMHFINPGAHDRDFTSIVAPPSGVNRTIVIINSGYYTGSDKKLKFKHEDSGGTSINRLFLADESDFDLNVGASVQFVYDHDENRYTTFTYY